MAEIKNLDRLISKLNKISSVSGEAALKKACLLVEGEAKANCPVDDGQLRQSITSEINNGTGYVGTNVEYAPYVHQGTGIYAAGGNGRQDSWSYQDASGHWHTTVGQHPNPFLEKALDSNKKDIKTLFIEEIRRAARD